MNVIIFKNEYIETIFIEFYIKMQENFKGSYFMKMIEHVTNNSILGRGNTPIKPVLFSFTKLSSIQNPHPKPSNPKSAIGNPRSKR